MPRRSLHALYSRRASYNITYVVATKSTGRRSSSEKNKKNGYDFERTSAVDVNNEEGKRHNFFYTLTCATTPVHMRYTLPCVVTGFFFSFFLEERNARRTRTVHTNALNS